MPLPFSYQAPGGLTITGNIVKLTESRLNGVDAGPFCELFPKIGCRCLCRGSCLDKPDTQTVAGLESKTTGLLF